MARNTNETMRDVAKKVLAEKGHDPETGELVDDDGAVVDDNQVRKLVIASFSPETLAAIKIKRRVTIPTLSWRDGGKIVCMITSPIVMSETVQETHSGKPKMQPASVITIMAPNGTLRRLVVGTIMENELKKQYPNDEYVNCWFQLEKFPPDIGRDKKYSTYEIIEIDDPRA